MCPMMHMMSIMPMGLALMVPASVILAISFFVLFAAAKAEGNALKIFGYFVAVVLWLSAAVLFTAGIKDICCPGKPGMGMMKCMGPDMMKMGGQGGQPAGMMQ